MTHWDAENRQSAFEKGHALPPDTEGGEPRYPIESAQDVQHAVEDYHRSPPADADRVRAFITRRAIDLGATDKLPEDWRLVKVEGADDTEEDTDD